MLIHFRPNFLKIAALLVSLIFVTVKVNATHIVGGEVYYDCLGFNSASQTGTYRVTLLVYRDCSSSQNAAFDPNAVLGVSVRPSLTSSAWSEYVDGNFNPISTVPIGATISLPITTADPCLLPPANLCYERATYTATVTLPYNPNGYLFSYSRCCRNNTINNIQSPGSVGGTYDVYLSGPAQLACNSSPRFSGLPPTAICLNQPFTSLQSVIEPNGVDQITYSLCSAQEGNLPPGSGQPAGYWSPTNATPPFFSGVNYSLGSPSNPFPTSPSNPMLYNPTTGQLSFTPTAQGQFVVSMCVTETRNGTVMSYSRREFQFNVQTCSTTVNAVPHTNAVTSNGGVSYTYSSCNTNVVSFNNPSNDANLITGYRWFFNLGGTSTFSSTARYPTVTFPGPGQYTGYLICNPNLPVGANCRDSAGIVVNIYPPRDAAFSIRTDSCNAAASITFTNQSTAQGIASPIRAYSWSSAFTSSLANPTWRPSNAGSFTARLVITDANNCTDTETIPFDWFPRSNVSITNNTRQGCRPLNVTFVNSSTPYASSYVSEWTFGDNSPTFTGQTPPAKVYNTPGNYYVRLRIRSPWGCVSQDSVLIRVFDTPTANFSSTFDSCSTTSSPVLYTNRSTTGTVNAGTLSAWNWTFTSGTPGTSTAQNPALVSYPSSGNYNTTLRVTDINGCTSTVTRTLAYAPEPIQPTVITPQTICLNASATFSTFNYPAAYSVTWAFGDNSTLTSRNPSKLYSAPGTYVVTLTVRSGPIGYCSATFTTTVTVVDLPRASFTYRFDSCALTPVVFTNTSTRNPLGGNLTSWNWNFGGGQTATGVGPHNVTYPNTGNYTAILTITDENGCTNTATQNIPWLPEPVVASGPSNQFFCLYGSYSYFTNVNLPANYTVRWQFGDGATSTLRNGTHPYTASGVYQITMTVTSAPSRFCSSTVFATATVHDVPRSSFRYNYDSCATGPVRYIDQSTRGVSAPINNWSWTFASGTPATSSLQNPTVTYTNTGTYTSSLRVRDTNGCTATSSQSVPWIPEPIAPIVIPNQTLCLGQTATFNTPTYPSGYQIIWNFGDGTTATQVAPQAGPTRRYTAPGTYVVTAVVTSSPRAFCTSTFTTTVTVNDNPVAGFRIRYDSCAIGPVSFFDASTLGINSSPLTQWNWTFGNSTNSNIQNPTVTYATSGTYTVNLTVTNANGCASTVTRSVPWIPEPIAPIVIPNQTLCLGQTATFSIPTYRNGFRIRWNFGDGTTVTQVAPQATPTRRYTAPGVYVVTMDVLSAPQGFCTATFTTTVTINDNPTAGFRFRYDSCAVGPVSFFDASTLGTNASPLAQWRWTFGNATNSTLQNPTVTYATTGTYSVNLTVTNANGCASTSTQAVPWVPEPISTVTLPNQFICLGFPVNYTIPNYPASYQVRWSWGDGVTTTQVSGQTSATHTYTNPGIYRVSLSVVSGPQGFCNNTFLGNVTVNGLPTANFTFRYDSCAFAPVFFTDASTRSVTNNAINTWNWSFGDTQSSNIQNPNNLYATNGTYNVTLSIIDAAGCTSTVSRPVVYIPEPITPVALPLTATCFGDSMRFTNPAYPNNYTWVWNFGDGVTTTQNNPSHLYAAPGTYNVSFTVTSGPNGFCSYQTTASYVVNTRPIAQFSYTFDTCAIDSVRFLNTSLRNAANDPHATYNWDFNDLSFATQSPPSNRISHLYANSGTYRIGLTVTDVNGCLDSTYRSVQWYPEPIVAVSVSDVEVCFGDTVRFVNSSYPIRGYTTTWTFGDGGTSPLPSPNYVYNTHGTFNTRLDIISPTGWCRDSFNVQVIVHQRPTAQFAYSFDTCAIDSVRFNNTSLSNNAGDGLTRFDWAWGDGVVTTQFPPNRRQSYLYTNSDSFYVRLLINDINGCTDSTTQLVPWFPEPIVSVSVTDAEVCFGDTVRFVNNSYPIRGYTTTWNFGDGGTSPLPSPNYVFNRFGTFTSRLNIISPTGWCRDSFSTQVIVHERPDADFRIRYDSCSLAPVRFINDSRINTASDAFTSYNWTFGDNNGNTQTVPLPNVQIYQYTVRGPYTVALTVTDINGCTDTTSRAFRWVPEPIPGFILPDQQTCDRQAVQFNNPVLPTGYIINWNFGDTQTSNVSNPRHTYGAYGVYNARVQISSVPSGFCTFRDTAQITIHQLPTAAYRFRFDSCAIGDVRLMNDSRTNLANDALAQYQWNFGDASPILTQNTPLPSFIAHTYTTRNTYATGLTVTDANGCSNTASLSVPWLPEPINPFTLADQQACDYRQLLQFTNAAQPATYGIRWQFGDGAVSTTSSPQHSYGTYGVYTATVSVTSAPSGFCTYRDTALITVHQLPTAAYRFRFDSCAIGDVRLMNDSRTNLANDALTNYTWSFGDATPNGVQNTPLPSFIAHRYATTGVYNTILSVTDANGCIDTATVRVPWLPEPINPFTVPDQQACDYQQFLQFTNAIQPSAYGIRWQFGDGAVSTTSSPQHIYGTYGVYTATVSVTSGPSGFCTFRDTAIITVHQLPTAAYRFRYDSCAIGDVRLMNDSRTNLANNALVSYTWSFGDASTNGVQTAPLPSFISHRYSTPATYPTVLTVTDVNGCIDTAQVTVPWLPEPINPFTLPDQQACDYRQLLSFNNAIQPAAYNIRWQFGDGSVSTTNNPSHSYNRFGVYTATVSVTSGPQGFCTFRDTAIVTIHQLPMASYRFRYDSCAIGDVRLENTSRTNAAGNPFASYRWDFGDTNIGLQNTLPLPNFISHTYATRGTYPTSLLATDINGCTATSSVIVPWVPEPIPLIVMPDQALCDRETFSFNSPAMPFGYRINWNFGDGTPSSSLQSPTHVYSQFGRYTATVAVNSAPQGFCQSFYQANIEVRELPRPSSLGVTPTLCFGSTDGAIISQVQGGRAPYSYAWSNNLSTSYISGIAAGAYILTVTDAYGCSGVSTPITVTQPDLITGIVTRRQNISCHSVCDGQLEIQARGGNGTYRYAWDSGQTTSAISGLCAGAYNLVITDQNNCLGYMNNVTVTQPAPLRALAAGTNVRCFGESSGQVAAITQGGTYPYFYRWNTQPVDLDSVANNLPIGTYTVNVLDNNGCKTTASATIVQPSQLVASVTADTVSCFATPDGTAQIRSIIGGTSPYQVSWDNNNTGLFTSQLTGGPHQVTISDNIGCQIVLPFTVVSPNPILVFTTNIRNVSCHGFSDGYLAVNPQGGVRGGYSYIWNNGLFGTAQLNNLRAGQYSVTVSDSNGCTGTQQNIVVTEPAPITLTVVSTIGRVTCNGDATGALLTSASGGTPSYNYFWSGGNRTAALTGLVAGTYTVSSTDANGCTAATVSGVITEPVPLSVGVTATDPICFNTLGNIELAVDLNTGTPNFRISFDGGNTFTRTTDERYVYAGAPDGTYNIVVRDANSCPYFTTVTLVEPLEILLSMPANQQIVLGDSILLPTSLQNAIGNPTYLWSPIDGSLSCLNCDSPTAQPTRTTEYSLLVTDANGCRASGNVSVEVDRARRVFIPNAFTPNDDGQNDFFVPEGGTDVAYVESMIIADRWGGILFTNNNFQVGNRQSGWNGEMNGEELNPGVYVYMITIRFKDGNSEVFKGDVTLLR